MKYMGSKNRHANELLKLILKDRSLDQIYVEPFVGGFNMIDKVSGPRIGADIHTYLISLFKGIQDGWIPPDTISECEYLSIKNNPQNYDPILVGFVGFGCSYSGKWFGGYARGNSANGAARNYCLESKNNIMKQANLIKGVDIRLCSYEKLEIPDNSIVYCDPPYANTTKYKDQFDHTKFWNWVRKLSVSGHKVFISEYTAPFDFKCIFEKECNNTLVKNTGSKKGIERLFTYN